MKKNNGSKAPQVDPTDIMFREAAKELEEYFMKLEKEAAICQNEAKRAIERFCETGEMTFRINDEILDADKFFRMLKMILTIKIPSSSIRDILTLPEQRVKQLMRQIADLRDYLYKLPGARFKINDVPDIYKKIHIETKEIVIF